VEDGDRRLFLHLMLPRREEGASAGAQSPLTPRQQQVLARLADGMPAKVIAARLGLAEATVRNHVRGVLGALGVHSQLEAVAKARRLELVP
jgi:DNA-binding NarL/FixJ family response regulator